MSLSFQTPYGENQLLKSSPRLTVGTNEIAIHLVPQAGTSDFTLLSVHLLIQFKSILLGLAYEGHHKVAIIYLSWPMCASNLGQFSTRLSLFTNL